MAEVDNTPGSHATGVGGSSSGGGGDDSRRPFQKPTPASRSTPRMGEYDLPSLPNTVDLWNL